MREIRFRTWDFGNKFWRYFEVINGKPAFGVAEIFPNIYPNKMGDWLQFTGFKDKNRKQIFEDDVVKAVDEMAGVEFVGRVFFYPNLAYFAIAIAGDYDSHLNFKDVIKIEIIGNVQENPELLK